MVLRTRLARNPRATERAEAKGVSWLRMHGNDRHGKDAQVEQACLPEARVAVERRVFLSIVHRPSLDLIE